MYCQAQYYLQTFGYDPLLTKVKMETTPFNRKKG